MTDLRRSFGLLLCCLTLWLLPSAALAQTAKVFSELRGVLEFSPDGRYLVNLHPQSVRFLSPDGQSERHRLPASSPVNQLKFSADGRFFVTSSPSGHYVLWRLADFKQLARIHDPAPGMWLQPFALSPDSIYLTLGKLENSAPNRLDLYLHTWDLRSQKRVQRTFATRFEDALPGHYPDIGLAYHPLGRYLATAVEWSPQKTGKKNIMIYDNQTQRWQYWVPGSPPFAYSQNGHYFAFLVPVAGDARHWALKLWHTPTNRLKTVKLSASAPPQPGIALSRQAKYLAFAQPSKLNRQTIQVVRVQDLKSVLSFEVPDSADTFSFSHNEQQLVVSSRVNADLTPTRYLLP